MKKRTAAYTIACIAALTGARGGVSASAAPGVEASTMGGMADTTFIVGQPVAEPDTAWLPTHYDGARYWSIHTNMLLDAAAIPNLGFEVSLGRRFSLAANWWYAWWKDEPRHRFWRTYGGYIAPRLWLGKRAKRKPLTGHHLGVYGQVLLYDFEWGGVGYLSGVPGKNIFHRPTWAAGLEYGIAVPVGRRVNLDFTIGVGYMQGRYLKYEPASDNHYVWLATYNRRWIGPTKAEISLVLLLGKHNVNQKRRH